MLEILAIPTVKSTIGFIVGYIIGFLILKFVIFPRIEK